MTTVQEEQLYLHMSFNEQMMRLGAEVERILHGRCEPGDLTLKKIDRLFQIIGEDPKNIPIARELGQAQRELRAYLNHEADALSEEAIRDYWYNYRLAYKEEVKRQPVWYFLMRGYSDCPDADEWLGIYESTAQLQAAYEKAVRELNQENQEYIDAFGNDRSVRYKVSHERVQIHSFHHGHWAYDLPPEALFAKKEDELFPVEDGEIVVNYILSHASMFEFKERWITYGKYGEYVYKPEYASRRETDESMQVHFKVKHSWEILEIMWRYWGGRDQIPPARTMAEKAREWEEKYDAKLVEIAHDWLVFRTRGLSEKEAGDLWEDVCKIAPNSRDIMSASEKDARVRASGERRMPIMSEAHDIVEDGKKRLLEGREVALWWD